MSRVSVSIVVPVYGVQQYIDKCVESILDQKFSDIEVILVDDESPDNCPAICDDYAKKDKRVKVIHKKNGGLSDARNAGLKAATGQYIAFIDGDDYVSPDYVQTLYNACVENRSDISCCGYYKVYGDRLEQKPKIMDHKNFTNIEAIRDIFTAGTLCEVMTWNKLYRRNLFTNHDIRFPVGKIHEDNFTTYKLFYYAGRVSFINVPLYYYIQRSGSIMGKAFSSKRFHLFEMLIEAKEFFADKSEDMANELQSARLMWTLGLYNDYLTASKRNPEDGKVLRQELRSTRAIYSNKMITAKHKLLYTLVRLSPWLYGKMRAKYDQRV